MQRYYPRTEGDQIMWFNNLGMKIVSYYTALNINLAIQAQLTTVLAWLIWTWATYIPSPRHEGLAATQWRLADTAGRTVDFGYCLVRFGVGS